MDSGVAGRALVADLLKVFFDHNLHGQLDDYGGDGGVVVFGWSKASKIGKTFYDEGRVDLQVGNGSHTMTIDDDTDKEYSFSYRSI